MFNEDEGMRSLKHGDMFLAGQESRDYFDFISDVGIRGIYLSLALGTANSNNYVDQSCSFLKFLLFLEL